MDLCWGFNNIRIQEGNEAKAAFVMELGLFKPTVMQFRLCNAPMTFQRMMDKVLALEKQTGKVEVYVDDILIFTDTKEENWQVTEQVIRRLKDHWLCSRPRKCKFEVKKVTFLGQVVKDRMVWMNEEKVKKVQTWRTLRNKMALILAQHYINCIYEGHASPTPLPFNIEYS
jgi:hypothetical protein